MKKLIPFMIPVVLLFAACSKKSTAPATGNSLIVGKWHYTADTVKTYSNGILASTSATAIPSDNYLQFNASGQGEAGADNGSSDVFSYNINGNILTRVNPGTPPVTRVATIEKLTANTLVLFFDYSSVIAGTTFRVTEIAYLTK